MLKNLRLGIIKLNDDLCVMVVSLKSITFCIIFVICLKCNRAFKVVPFYFFGCLIISNCNCEG